MPEIRQSDVGEIDFKPFVDAIVGIVFVLLIIIMAELFFTKWNDASKDPQEQARLNQIEWEIQATVFLQDFADQLHKRGLNPELNLLEKSVSFSLAQLVSLDTNYLPKVKEQSQTIGEVLFDRLLCLPEQVGRQSPNCPVLDMLKLDRVNVEVQVTVPEGAMLEGDRYAEYLRVLFNAALIEGAPKLLTITGSAPRIIESTGKIAAMTSSAGESRPAGDVTLRFMFHQPPS